MKILASTGEDRLATVHIAGWGENRQVEMVESVQPPHPRKDKWVLIISTLFGCPGRCLMCDAGADYRGRLDTGQLLDQLDYLVERRYPDRRVPVLKFKVQFARMGDPALNPAVLDVLEQLPERYHAPGLLPCISTIAPHKAAHFFEQLLEIKQRRYAAGRFQMQFSVHSTDSATRDRLMPLSRWNLKEMADYGERFFAAGDRKIALNFALMENVPIDPVVLAAKFDPTRFAIKLTPLNPTYAAAQYDLHSRSKRLDDAETHRLVDTLRTAGFDVIVSVGELAENQIGSNCGQYLSRYLSANAPLGDAYRKATPLRTSS